MKNKDNFFNVEAILKRFKYLSDRNKELNEELNENYKEIGTLQSVINTYKLDIKESDIIQPFIGNILDYPINGSVGDKIKYAIVERGQPSSAIDISVLIALKEPQDEMKLLNKISTYCSTMAKNGELTYIKQGKKNLYSTIKEQ